ncbi:MAG: cytochrome c biogenesis protein ResB [Antricoccus sp.]
MTPKAQLHNGAPATVDGAVKTDDLLWKEDANPKRPRGTSLKEMSRYWWRQLTAMRTALILLFLLALASVPGSLLPQRALSVTKVNEYYTRHTRLAPILDKLGFFSVFSSPWYSAIYLLLFISLIGCLGPRIKVYWKALRAAPPEAPRRLNRIGEYTSESIDDAPPEVLDQAERVLRKARWRVVRRTSAEGVESLAAEKGFMREAGNLVFHLSLLALLLALAVGKFIGYEGSRIATEGQGFCNQQQSYDTFGSGPLVSSANMMPICVTLNKFRTTYDADLTPAKFTGNITWKDGINGAKQNAVVGVNDPLRTNGVRVYITGHGYAPVFTVTLPDGTVLKDQTAPFLPTDQKNFGSEGVVKLETGNSEKSLALQGFFAPTAVEQGGVVVSADPRLLDPEVALLVYQGYNGLDSGIPQSVYTLDPKLIKDGLMKKVGAMNMKPGQTLTLTDGTKVTFDKVIEWAAFQVSYDPSEIYVLGAAIVLLIGLTLSLSLRRRRLWVRVTGDTDQVEIGGLAHTQPAAFAREFGELSGRILDRAPPDIDEES